LELLLPHSLLLEVRKLFVVVCESRTPSARVRTRHLQLDWTLYWQIDRIHGRTLLQLPDLDEVRKRKEPPTTASSVSSP
jgi:hypothetical protein